MSRTSRVPMDQSALTGPSLAVEVASPRVMWQEAPGARSLVVTGPLSGAVAGDLGEGAGGGVDAGVDGRGEGLALQAEIGDGEVRVMAALEVVWMPKSSSLGEKTIASGAAEVKGRLAVWVVALVAWTVMVPGPLPVSAMLHSAAAGSVLGQLVERVKPVAVSWRLLAGGEPRLRRVMLGESSVERREGWCSGEVEFGEIGCGAGAEAAVAGTRSRDGVVENRWERGRGGVDERQHRRSGWRGGSSWWWGRRFRRRWVGRWGRRRCEVKVDGDAGVGERGGCYAAEAGDLVDNVLRGDAEGVAVSDG